MFPAMKEEKYGFLKLKKRTIPDGWQNLGLAPPLPSDDDADRYCNWECSFCDTKLSIGIDGDKVKFYFCPKCMSTCSPPPTSSLYARYIARGGYRPGSNPDLRRESENEEQEKEVSTEQKKSKTNRFNKLVAIKKADRYDNP